MNYLQWILFSGGVVCCLAFWAALIDCLMVASRMKRYGRWKRMGRETLITCGLLLLSSCAVAGHLILLLR